MFANIRYIFTAIICMVMLLLQQGNKVFNIKRPKNANSILEIGPAAATMTISFLGLLRLFGCLCLFCL